MAHTTDRKYYIIQYTPDCWGGIDFCYGLSVCCTTKVDQMRKPYEMITTTVTLLYNHTEEIDKRQIFLYETPSKIKAHFPK